MAAGEAIGCFGLTEADFGVQPAGMRTHARRDPGGDWVLSGSKMWITNGSVADVAVVWARPTPTATDSARGGPVVRGFVVPTDTPGFSALEITRKMSLRASVTSSWSWTRCGCPRTRCCPGPGFRAAVVPERGPYGIVFGALGAARDCLETTIAYAGEREIFDKRSLPTS